MVIRFLLKVSGYSRQQLDRLIAQYRNNGRLVRRHSAGNGFVRKYTRQDVALLVKLDELHDSSNGMAIKKLAERALEVFGDQRNLAGVSVTQIYRMRGSKAYLRNSLTLEKTRPGMVPIGERRKPQPNGKPGYIRIDTVHQGDLDKVKGVYHINAVDEVTQMQVMVSVAVKELQKARRQLFETIHGWGRKRA